MTNNTDREVTNTLSHLTGVDQWAEGSSQRLVNLSLAQRALDRAISEQVDASRAAGESWAMIGLALGISKQAAQQRFGK